MQYDDIIVGSGSSGAVLASRLSEDPDRQVLLLECGEDFPDIDSVPSKLLDHNLPVLHGYNWSVDGFANEENVVQTLTNAGKSILSAKNRYSLAKTAIKSATDGKNVVGRFDYPVGRVVGGTSAINGALALRSTPEDFAEWTKLGNDYWAWDEVLECFKALESDQDRNDDYHGKQGMLPIRHMQPEFFTPVQRCFFNICREYGFEYAKDHNAPNSTGIGGLPKNTDSKGRRISAALAFLNPARSRNNLNVKSEVLVNRVLHNNGKAIGVEAFVQGRPVRIMGHRITLSAGVMHSPTILLRSGIGSEIELKRLRIDTVKNLPGVGRNFMDHPVVGIWAVPKDGVCPLGQTTHEAMLRYSSKLGLRNDMELYALSAFDTGLIPYLKEFLNANIAMMLSAIVTKPFSRGKLHVLNDDPRVSPRVYANLLATQEDMERMIEGVRQVWSIIKHSDMQNYIERIPVWNQRTIDDDIRLKQLLKTFVRGLGHAVGTARMGAEQDEMSVVNQFGQVHGCENLRVVDASIMPVIVRTPTSLTCMMLAEKIAHHMRYNEG